MTAIERRLAKTFRAARWADVGGKPVCALCFEGDAVVADDRPRLACPGLQSYRCRDCNHRFSDLSGTPLRGTNSLRDWALALLTISGHPTELAGSGRRQRYVPVQFGPTPERLDALRAKLSETTDLRAAWARALREAGVTAGKVSYGKRAAA